MESEMIQDECFFCREKAQGKVKKDGRELELCEDCAKDLFWILSRDASFFEED